jgi:hypothetical protein
MAGFESAIGEHTMKALLGTAALLALLLPAAAQAQSREVKMIWFEDASCSAWSKSAGNKAIRAIYSSWVRGFVSGHNFGNLTQQVKVDVSDDALYQYIDQYCRDNPKSSFAGGAIQLVENLREPPAGSKQAPAKPAPAKKEPAKAAPAAKETYR